MRFLSAWTEVGTPTLFLALIAPLVLGLSVFLPGRRVARVTALALSMAVLALGVVGLGAGMRWSWAGLWLLVAWRVGKRRPRTEGPIARPGGVESGAIGLLLGLALVGLLVSAVARQNLEPDQTRCASYGIVLLVFGLLHLMLRRDARRALLAFGGVGLGLQILHGAARDDLLGADVENRGAVLLASAIALALADRVVRMREIASGTAWVSEAHDLHD